MAVRAAKSALPPPGWRKHGEIQNFPDSANGNIVAAVPVSITQPGQPFDGMRNVDWYL